MGVKNGAKISANWYRSREHKTKKAVESACEDIYLSIMDGEVW